MHSHWSQLNSIVSYHWSEYGSFMLHIQLCYIVCVCVCVVAGDEVSSSQTGLSYDVAEVGILQTKRVPTPRL